LTVGAGAALIWSGLDALAGVDDYEDDPTQEALEEGQTKERRTNILIGATAGAAAVTLLLAALTDWGGGDEGREPAVSARATVLPSGGAAIVEGRF